METSKPGLGWDALSHPPLSTCQAKPINCPQGLAGHRHWRAGRLCPHTSHLSSTWTLLPGLQQCPRYDPGGAQTLGFSPSPATPAPLSCQGSLTFLLLHSSLQREKKCLLKQKANKSWRLFLKFLLFWGRHVSRTAAGARLLAHHTPLPLSSQISQGQDSKGRIVPITLPDRAGKHSMNQAGHPGWEYRAGSRFKGPCGPMKPLLHLRERERYTETYPTL